MQIRKYLFTQTSGVQLHRSVNQYNLQTNGQECESIQLTDYWAICELI